MYGLIAKIKVVSGQADNLINILLNGTLKMPGCVSYVVAKDSQHADAIWVTEVWESKEHHAASLSLPSVQQAMSMGRPLISGFEQRVETHPVTL